ncbi:MAG: alpha-2-macroglobulin family protein, partial [Bacteroidota bacterium]
ISARLLSRANHTPTALSDVVHLKLYDPRGRQIDSTAVVLHDGVAKADFYLGTHLPGGLYELRGYTRWMMNGGKKNYFSKRLTVLKAETPRLLMELDFDREGYGTGDTVQAQLKVRSLSGEAAAGATVQARWSLGGNLSREDALLLNDNGEATLAYPVPQLVANSAGLLNAVVNYQGTQESVSRRIPLTSGSVYISFYPEGGRYVPGMPARLGFKAVDQYQQGVDVSGVIKNQDGATVATFESFHMGMGAVEFTPEPHQAYFAHIQKPTAQRPQGLPIAQDRGWVMRHDTTLAQEAQFTVYSQEPDTAYVVAHSRGKLRHTQQVLLQAGANPFTMPLDSFPRGTAVVTLWDARLQLARCERLVFLDHQQGLQIQLATEKKYYRPREEIEVKIRTTDAAGRGVPAQLSLAAVDEQVLTFADDQQDNLLSYFLLSSEVRGKIEEPAFYLDPDEPKAAQARDYLLMTQGWRGFSYETLWKSLSPPRYAAEQETVLTGRLFLSDATSGAKGTVYLIESAGKRRILPVRTTPQGYFSFHNLDPTVVNLLAVRKPLLPGILKEGQVTIQAPTESRRARGWPTPRWSSTFPDPGNTTIPSPIPQPKVGQTPRNAPANTMSLEEDASQLDEVVVTSYGVSATRSLAQSVTISTGGYEELGSQGLPTYLAGTSVGVRIRGQAGAAQYFGARAAGLSSAPLLVLDGVPVAPEDRDQALSMLGTQGQRITTIFVLKGLQATQVYGSLGAAGVIQITTQESEPDQPLFDLAPRYNALVVYPKRYRTMRTFYPVVASAGERSSQVPVKDRRTTLYWNHEVRTDENGEATLTFRAGDKESSFALVAEGFTAQGDLGRGEATLSVGLPLSVDVKLPAYLSVNDTVRAAVQLRNGTDDTLKTLFTVMAPPEIYRVSHLPEGPVVIPPKQSISVPVQVSVPTYQVPSRKESQRGIGPFQRTTYEYLQQELTFQAVSGPYEDALPLPLPLRSTGFPRYISQTSIEPHHAYTFRLEDPEHTTVHGTFKANSDVLSQVLSTL